MKRTTVRAICASAIAAPLLILGAGYAAAAPTLGAGTDPGTVTIGLDTAGKAAKEGWTCILGGADNGGGMHVIMGNSGDSPGGFANGAAVTAVCGGMQSPYVTMINGTAQKGT
ncbi:hypothetical protein FOS14_07090 [Skermania sp. ID1734]|uniref:hypothetical protein n=1 Tax=Skermania sp. ID1734 TaxID=2597516 RepID=UPI00117EB6E5|nr:hypothetical protein [Skermania sp. ID1734]TSE00768.1 hypothetical protein FOS14_07090 [Skermania sp. ID1734]